MTIKKNSNNILSPWANNCSLAHRAKELKDEVEGKSFRSPYARDRDRILYSQAFRRLTHKTQVYLTSNSNGQHDDHCRTRLTHTLEVAQIAKSMALELNLNIELTEAIAFGHDVGHTPFGHAGERQIDDFLNGRFILPSEILEKIQNPDSIKEKFPNKDFKHNFQSVRLLTILEKYSTHEPGLNLCCQTLYGILHHSKITSISNKKRRVKYPSIDVKGPTSFHNIIKNAQYRSVEAWLVNIADEIAQVVHDLCDAIKIGAVPIHEITTGSMQKIYKKSKVFATGMGKEINSSMDDNSSENVAQLCTIFINYFTVQTCTYIKKNILNKSYSDPNFEIVIEELSDIIAQPAQDFELLQDFKNSIVVNNYFVNRMDNKGRFLIRQLIRSYLSDPRQLPDSIIANYCNMKRIQHATSLKRIKRWITSGLFFKPQYQLDAKEIKTVFETIPSLIDGNDLRQLNGDLITKLVPYLCFDVDYLRTVADFIASMTDGFAENEYKKLYL